MISFIKRPVVISQFWLIIIGRLMNLTILNVKRMPTITSTTSHLS